MPLLKSCPNTIQIQKVRTVEKILFTDDDLSLLQLYQEEFSEEGYEVILARDGEQALVKFKEEFPHVVIMDIRMPGMDVMEVVRMMLKENPDVSIILNTAYSHYKCNSFAEGAVVYVPKSSDLTKLKQKVREMLDKKL